MNDNILQMKSLFLQFLSLNSRNSDTKVRIKLNDQSLLLFRPNSEFLISLPDFTEILINPNGEIIIKKNNSLTKIFRKEGILILFPQLLKQIALSYSEEVSFKQIIDNSLNIIKYKYK